LKGGLKRKINLKKDKKKKNQKNEDQNWNKTIFFLLKGEIEKKKMLKKQWKEWELN
jgi:hypothetical protein